MLIISSKLISLGFYSIVLEVRVDNEVAISLYEKVGFGVVKTLKSFYGDGCDAYFTEFKFTR